MSTETNSRRMGTEFNIGDRVRVKATAVVRKEWRGAGREDRKIKRRVLREPFEATVTGETFRREGFTQYNGDDGTCFTPGRAVLVVLVRTLKRRRELDVFPEDLELVRKVRRTNCKEIEDSP